MSGKRPATYQDVLDAPEHMVAELIDGELVLSPRPSIPHGSVTTALAAKLFSRFGAGGSADWFIIVEPELHLGDLILVPDIAGWRTSRLPSLPVQPYFTLAPDWVCETASKSTEKLDRKRKLPIYAAAGVEYAWIVHPRLRTLEVFRSHERKWLLVETFSDNDCVHAVPFESFELDLSHLWRGLPFLASEGSELYVPY